MKRYFVLILAAAFSLAAAGWSSAQEKEFRGAITDEMCGAEHMMEGMNAKECTDECVKMGSKYALYVPAEKKVYALDKQEEAARFSGESVLVKGTLAADGKTIQVSSIQKAGG